MGCGWGGEVDGVSVLFLVNIRSIREYSHTVLNYITKRK